MCVTRPEKRKKKHGADVSEREAAVKAIPIFTLCPTPNEIVPLFNDRPLMQSGLNVVTY